MRIRHAISTHQPVDAEIRVIRIIAEVAAVGPVLFFPSRVPSKTLIDPIPDVRAGKAGIALHHFPVLGEIAARIAHHVSVFGEHNRPFIAFALPESLKPCRRRIKHAQHVGVAGVVLVVNWPRVVDF